MKKAERVVARTRIIYILTTVFLVGLSFYVYIQIRNLLTSSDSVNHTNQVTLSLGKTLIFILDAETNQREYLLTGDSSLMSRRQNDISLVNTELGKIDSLVADNPAQGQNLRLLHVALNEKLAGMNTVLQAYEDRAPGVELKKEISAGVLKMDRLKAMIKLMAGTERIILDGRTKRYSTLAVLTPILIIALFLGSLIILFASYNSLNKQFRRSAEFRDALSGSNNNLQALNQSYEYAEQVGLFGSYRYMFAEKSLYYSDNLFRLLGCEPGSFKPGAEEFLSFVHPDDKEYVQQATSAAFTDQKISRWEYRMIRKDGRVIYVRGTGKLISENGEIRSLVGTLQDITEEKKLEINLHAKNDELEQMNKELQSFAYISSHDLQEPLRKIQIYASQVMESDEKNLGDEGKKKFKKMQEAANRMQNLIQDLLQYSKAGVADKNFKKTDLKMLTNGVISDLAEEINASHATIRTDEMCELPVIEFQFKQLLYNIIGNSLKFRQQHIDPVINISTETASAAQLGLSGAPAKEVFCHIRIRDNGIGFDEEYSTKIFEVFQRLHNKQEFTGTGIGLAIVKKIVENHNGFIRASGSEGSGAAFDIFLPVFHG